MSAYRHLVVVAPDVGGKYIEGVVGTIQLPNPIFGNTGDADADVARLVYNGLLRNDGSGNLVPDLALSYDVSQDKKVYTFFLRKDVRWHDGEPFTSKDVLYTIGAIQNPKTGSPIFVTFQNVVVSAPDDQTVRFELKEPFVPFFSALTVGILPEHLWKSVMPERMRLSKLTLEPVGTGPYMLSRLVKDGSGYIMRYELARNTKYFRQPPYIQDFVFQFFSDYDGATGAIQALREQKIDGLNFVPHDLNERVLRKHIHLHTLDLPQYTALFLNGDHSAILKDAVIRRALDMALPKERIVHEALKDEGSVIHGPILPGFPGFESSPTTTPYDIDGANALLDTVAPRATPEEFAGAIKKTILSALAVSSTTSTASGKTSDNAVEAAVMKEVNPAQTFYRKGKDGAYITLHLVTADTVEYRQVASLISGFWQEIGIKTIVTKVNPADLSQTVLRNRDYDVLLYGLIIGSDPDQYPFWHSSQRDFPGLNLSRYANPLVDDLLIKARATSDPDEEKAFSAKIQSAILADRPAIFLYTPTYTFAATDAVQGIPHMRIFEPSDRLSSIADWYIKTKGRWNLK